MHARDDHDHHGAGDHDDNSIDDVDNNPDDNGRVLLTSEGGGPEMVAVADPEPRRYSARVHHVSGERPTSASLRVYIDGAQIAIFDQELVAGEVWEAAEIRMPGGTLSNETDGVTTAEVSGCY